MCFCRNVRVDAESRLAVGTLVLNAGGRGRGRERAAIWVRRKESLRSRTVGGWWAVDMVI